LNAPGRVTKKELADRKGFALRYLMFVAATDNDDAGDKASEFIKAACEVALQDGAYVRKRPEGAKDWNDVLTLRHA
jgi:hypothetical protein